MDGNSFQNMLQSISAPLHKKGCRILNHNVVPSKALFLQVHVVQRQLVYLATICGNSPARLIARVLKFTVYMILLYHAPLSDDTSCCRKALMSLMTIHRCQTSYFNLHDNIIIHHWHDISPTHTHTCTHTWLV